MDERERDGAERWWNGLTEVQRIELAASLLDLGEEESAYLALASVEKVIRRRRQGGV